MSLWTDPDTGTIYWLGKPSLRPRGKGVVQADGVIRARIEAVAASKETFAKAGIATDFCGNPIEAPPAPEAPELEPAPESSRRLGVKAWLDEAPAPEAPPAPAAPPVPQELHRWRPRIDPPLNVPPARPAPRREAMASNYDALYAENVEEPEEFKLRLERVTPDPGFLDELDLHEADPPITSQGELVRYLRESPYYDGRRSVFRWRMVVGTDEVGTATLSLPLDRGRAPAPAPRFSAPPPPPTAAPAAPAAPSLEDIVSAVVAKLAPLLAPPPAAPKAPPPAELPIARDDQGRRFALVEGKIVALDTADQPAAAEPRVLEHEGARYVLLGGKLERLGAPPPAPPAQPPAPAPPPSAAVTIEQKAEAVAGEIAALAKARDAIDAVSPAPSENQASLVDLDGLKVTGKFIERHETATMVLANRAVFAEGVQMVGAMIKEVIKEDAAQANVRAQAALTMAKAQAIAEGRVSPDVADRPADKAPETFPPPRSRRVGGGNSN